MLTTGGIVLCGGRSSRMGRPKAWLPFGTELMLPRERLAAMVQAYYAARGWDDQGGVPVAVGAELHLDD